MDETERARRGILIVEDNEINREMLRLILTDRYRVIEAVDGADGIEKLKQHFRDLSLILLDVQMPHMDGYEFLRRSREDELLSSVPVIVTTGSDISEDEERCLALGASDFVTKPYNPRVILRRIEAIIRLHESIATLQAVEYDSLTGLYTKNAFYHHAGNRLRYAEDGAFDLLMINVEDFAYVNERYGESAGDDLLRHIGTCLLTAADDVIVSCRYHADRFVLMRRHRESDHRQDTARLDTLLHRNAPLGDFVLKFAAYDRVPADTAVGVLCDRLSLAIRTVKHQYNRQVALYDDAMSARLRHLRRIEESMEDALRERQFIVYYQPKHDARTGRVAGAEALVRWIHPEYGFVSPGEFVPLFEENGFVTDLDLYIWRTVCADLKRWQDEGIPLVPVSVNASRRDFLTVRDADAVLRPIEENGLDRRYLHIEITESLGIGDALVLQKVKAIRDRGIAIELDDFGSGQSSLGTLCDIPMDVIKLDAGFTRALDRQKEVVRMIVSLAHALGHQTVAEGVETAEQLALLREFGCDLIQGYYYSKPLTAEAFRNYLKDADRRVEGEQTV